MEIFISNNSFVINFELGKALLSLLFYIDNLYIITTFSKILSLLFPYFSVAGHLKACNCTQLTGMLGTVALDQWACLFKLHPTSVHVCSTFSHLVAQASMPQGQQTYLQLRMFDYVALDQHTSLKPSSYVCNGFTKLAGMLQYPCFKRCFETTGMFVAVGTSVTIKLDQHACLLEWHLQPDMFESVATD